MIRSPDILAASVTARFTDRLNFGLLYGLIAVIIIWFGFRMVNHAWEVRFFKDYLLRWEVSLDEFEAHQGVWPVFSGGNHGEYMDGLTAQLSRAGIPLPRSNTSKAYRYRIEGFGREKEDIFVMVLQDRLLLYGINAKTLTYLERSVDGQVDFEHGRISGRVGKNNNTYIGQWRL